MDKKTTDVSKKLYGRDFFLIAWILFIGLAEGSQICALVLGWSFSAYEKMLLGLLALTVAVVGVFWLLLWQRRKKDILWQKARQRHKVRKKLMGREITAREQVIRLLFVVIVLVQSVLLLMERTSFMVGDGVVETVNTMLTTDTLYQFNPFTGRGYTSGMPLRLQILCLPPIYACVCDVLSLSAQTVVWTVAPIVTLLLGYIAFSLVGSVLVDKEHRSLFLLLVALLLFFGNYIYGMDGFGVQYAGGRGETMRAVILLPYVLSAVLRKKWWLAVLCVIAEACLVWTLYGLGYCLLMVVGVLAVQFFLSHKKGGIKT